MAIKDDERGRSAFGVRLEASLEEIGAYRRGEVDLPIRIVAPMEARQVKAIR